MKQLQEKLLALLLMALLSGTGAYAQEAPDKQKTPDKVVIFRFLPGEEMFSLKDNEAELERLYMLVDKHRAEITAGRMPVYVDGYCAHRKREPERGIRPRQSGKVGTYHAERAERSGFHYCQLCACVP